MGAFIDWIQTSQAGNSGQFVGAVLTALVLFFTVRIGRADRVDRLREQAYRVSIRVGSEDNVPLLVVKNWSDRPVRRTYVIFRRRTLWGRAWSTIRREPLGYFKLGEFAPGQEKETPTTSFVETRLSIVMFEDAAGRRWAKSYRPGRGADFVSGGQAHNQRVRDTRRQQARSYRQVDKETAKAREAAKPFIWDD